MRKVAQYAVPPVLGLDFINGLLRSGYKQIGNRLAIPVQPVVKYNH
jgi:hypothetical protein